LTVQIETCIGPLSPARNRLAGRHPGLIPGHGDRIDVGDVLRIVDLAHLQLAVQSGELGGGHRGALPRFDVLNHRAQALVDPGDEHPVGAGVEEPDVLLAAGQVGRRSGGRDARSDSGEGGRASTATAVLRKTFIARVL